MPCWEYVLRDLPRCEQPGCPSAGIVSDVDTRRLKCGLHSEEFRERRRRDAIERHRLKEDRERIEQFRRAAWGF
jgi:hypothetical protein